MKITVLNGSEKHGITYRLKEEFLKAFPPDTEITEFYLPRDCPDFCAGCIACFAQGETHCKDSRYVQTIEQALLAADLIVAASPTYVMHATAAMKNLQDHLAYRFLPHRPAPEMFGKRAVIITQCIGAGAGGAAKDIRSSFSWWGIPKISTVTVASRVDVFWDKIPVRQQEAMLEKVRRTARRCAALEYTRPARTTLPIKVKFYCMRMMQKSIYQKGPVSLDAKYWKEQGWLDQKRPWKR